MGRLIFCCLWTLFALLMVLLLDLSDLSQMGRVVFYCFPVFGLLCIWLSWLHLRRWRTLRTETDGGVTFYIWTEFNGREMRSTDDPRPDWEAEDGDSDGDGGD
ncbi:MAG: hypothetical protein AAF376_00510 [Pseudomonadota bacterium]